MNQEKSTTNRVKSAQIVTIVDFDWSPALGNTSLSPQKYALMGVFLGFVSHKSPWATFWDDSAEERYS